MRRLPMRTRMPPKSLNRRRRKPPRTRRQRPPRPMHRPKMPARRRLRRPHPPLSRPQPLHLGRMRRPPHPRRPPRPRPPVPQRLRPLRRPLLRPPHLRKAPPPARQHPPVHPRLFRMGVIIPPIRRPDWGIRCTQRGLRALFFRPILVQLWGCISMRFSSISSLQERNFASPMWSKGLILQEKNLS
jgi:hypothetical protein